MTDQPQVEANKEEFLNPADYKRYLVNLAKWRAATKKARGKTI